MLHEVHAPHREQESEARNAQKEVSGTAGDSCAFEINIVELD